MTLDELRKDYGFESIEEIESLGDVKRRTLYNWLENNPVRLKAYLLGCWTLKCGGLETKGE